MGPCAKVRVVCFIHIKGLEDPIVGENVCLTPQQKCPRAKGEGYLKCHTICSQLGHAEDVALRQMRLAGHDPQSVERIQVFGQPGPCEHCRASLVSLGLLQLTTFYGDVRPKALDEQERLDIASAYQLSLPQSHFRAIRAARLIESKLTT